MKPNRTLPILVALSALTVARAALAPSVELHDYKAIAKARNAAKEEIAVSDEEHRETLTHLRRERARIGKIEAGVEPQKAAEEARAMREEELPALDDAFVRSLGMESAEKFSETVRANIRTEKELQAREKRRAAILEELVKVASISYPRVLLEYELDDMEARLKHDIVGVRTTWEAYLAQAKKTREQLRQEWNEAAGKRAKVRLILAEIARKENIEPDAERLRKECGHAKQHVPSADPEALRAHIAHALRSFRQNLEGVLRCRRHGIPHPADEIGRDVGVEEVRHRVDEDAAGFLPPERQIAKYGHGRP